MKKIIGMLCLMLALATSASADKACKFADVGKLKEHLAKHVTYPATGKAIKDACAKEMPDEFTADERACSGKKLKDGTTYKNAAEVEKALGV